MMGAVARTRESPGPAPIFASDGHKPERRTIKIYEKYSEMSSLSPNTSSFSVRSTTVPLF